MKAYPLDLLTLLHILSRQKQTGELIAEVRIPNVRKLGRAYLSIYDGKVDISSCMIIADQRSVLTEKVAFEYLQTLGTLDWIYTAKNSTGPLSPTPSPFPFPSIPVSSSQYVAISTSAFPVRVRTVSVEEFITWGNMHRVYRSVYNLADGERTIANIAVILGKSSETIIEIFSFLQQREAVQFVSERRKNASLT